MEKFLEKAKDCPFCGAEKKNLDISNKGNHIAVFCRKCYTYGPRVIEYSLPENIRNKWRNLHWFKSLKDMRNNSDGNKYNPVFVNNDNSEVDHDWYYEEAVRKWNGRG